MQPERDVQNSWIMFDHVKHIEHWIIMAYHVYDPTYYKVMTITICNMQFENTIAQQIMWMKLNATMLKHGFHKLNSKRFMADIRQDT
jgi:hypothetical protein